MFKSRKHHRDTKLARFIKSIRSIGEKNNSKQGVLVGLNYTGTRAALKGCYNDAKRMSQTLKTKYNYSNISILTDRNITIYYNILEVLEKLVSSEASHLFFQFSGHGTQVRDRNGDEKDGMDEALYSVGGTIITDDQINETLKKLKPGVTLVIIIDACHSGSIIDLPYQLDNDSNVPVKVNNDVWKNNNIICISGCRDNQVSMDVDNGTIAYGALSNAIQKVLSETKTEITWRMLVGRVRDELKRNQYAQIPQLSVSNPEFIDAAVNL